MYVHMDTDPRQPSNEQLYQITHVVFVQSQFWPGGDNDPCHRVMITDALFVPVDRVAVDSVI